jgi:hypothetical protein
MATSALAGHAAAAAAQPRSSARACPIIRRAPQQPRPVTHSAIFVLLALLVAAAALPSAAASASGRGPLYSQDPPAWAPRARRGPLASGNYDGRHRALLERLTSLRLPLSEHVIAQGYKFEPVPRQWARLTQKLTTPGSKVKIATFGGSVSVGYRLSKTSYPEQLVEWLQEAFPGVEFELVNLARRATAATFAALCLVQVRCTLHASPTPSAQPKTPCWAPHPTGVAHRWLQLAHHARGGVFSQPPPRTCPRTPIW